MMSVFPSVGCGCNAGGREEKKEIKATFKVRASLICN